jgi:hypothetical protein
MRRLFKWLRYADTSMRSSESKGSRTAGMTPFGKNSADMVELLSMTSLFVATPILNSYTSASITPRGLTHLYQKVNPIAISG